MGKCALIVDDSRTSRAVLQRILETHDLYVDHADSAESALDYLMENRPDVIFMDHLMPGMDGLEAVSAIKQNPDTATIPIMMYTSQKGDVYLGQARALGAVGVLPKEVEPVEVSKMLEDLHIVGDMPTPAIEEEVVAADEAPTAEYPILANVDHDMRLMLEDLFDQQRAIIKRDLRRSTRSIVDEVSSTLIAKQTEQMANARSSAGLLPAALGTAVAMVVAVVALSITMVQQNHKLNVLSDHNAGLTASLNQQETARETTEDALLNELQGYQQAIDDTRAATLTAIAWGMNRSGGFDFGEEPLGDRRVPDFEELGAHLMAIGFVGQIVVETHVGRHCLSLGANGYALADAELPADLCDTMGFDDETALEISRQQSMSMANLINSAGIRSDGAIRYLVVPRGASEPIVDYPVNPLLVSAGDWNRVADANNRIAITLLPDPVEPLASR